MGSTPRELGRFIVGAMDWLGKQAKRVSARDSLCLLLAAGAAYPSNLHAASQKPQTAQSSDAKKKAEAMAGKTFECPTLDQNTPKGALEAARACFEGEYGATPESFNMRLTIVEFLKDAPLNTVKVLVERIADIPKAPAVKTEAMKKAEALPNPFECPTLDQNTSKQAIQKAIQACFENEVGATSESLGIRLTIADTLKDPPLNTVKVRMEQKEKPATADLKEQPDASKKKLLAIKANPTETAQKIPSSIMGDAVGGGEEAKMFAYGNVAAEIKNALNVGTPYDEIIFDKISGILGLMRVEPRRISKVDAKQQQFAIDLSLGQRTKLVAAVTELILNKLSQEDNLNRLLAGGKVAFGKTGLKCKDKEDAYKKAFDDVSKQFGLTEAEVYWDSFFSLPKAYKLQIEFNEKQNRLISYSVTKNQSNQLGNNSTSTTTPSVNRAEMVEDLLVDGAFTKEQWLYFIKRSSKAIEGCIQSEHKRNPNLKGKLDLEITFGTDRKIIGITVKEDTLKNETVKKNVEALLKSWNFPKLDAPVKYPMLIVYTPTY